MVAVVSIVSRHGHIEPHCRNQPNVTEVALYTCYSNFKCCMYVTRWNNSDIKVHGYSICASMHLTEELTVATDKRF